jgi:hypothetical protein
MLKFINGHRFEIVRSPYTEIMNGESVRWIVDLIACRIVISATNDELMAATAEAILAAASKMPAAPPANQLPQLSPPTPAQSTPSAPAVMSGCFRVAVVYPLSFDPQWKHLQA